MAGGVLTAGRVAARDLLRDLLAAAFRHPPEIEFRGPVAGAAPSGAARLAREAAAADRWTRIGGSGLGCGPAA
ncbi:hypothetical protein [Rhizomonospora bruguierae]|uniref:hypothetical protein n=1 Tax=Rhizomonospora bruguierae TaxID=1581705 RepID=UPI001BD0748D|nr:hypothetical protein [Micromonospora sp. NBRC 107566]